jgi:hypothetical protein
MTVELERWSVRRFADGTQHFVGFCLESRDGRVSTKIVELDPESHTGKNRELGPAGRDGDAEWVWGRVWRILGDGQEWSDVTEELIPGSSRERTR